MSHQVAHQSAAASGRHAAKPARHYGAQGASAGIVFIPHRLEPHDRATEPFLVIY